MKKNFVIIIIENWLRKERKIMRMFLDGATAIMAAFMIFLTLRSLATRIKMNSFDLKTPKGKLDAMAWLSGGIEEKFEDVDLLIFSDYAEDERLVYDFSKYADTNIVALSAAGPYSRQGLTAAKNQTIYRFKDGSHLWVEGELYEDDIEV